MPRAGIGFIRFVFACVLVAACKPDPVGPVYFCDASSNRSRCGTTPEGTPFTCFGGKQLGAGSDFCTEPCATDIAVPDADSICLKKAKLRTCRPSEKTAEDPDGCGEYLACLRTDLIRDEGVCLAMQVCSTDTDCTGLLTTCGSTVLKALLPNAPYNTSNLQCVIRGCKARQTNCPVGETCLADGGAVDHAGTRHLCTHLRFRAEVPAQLRLLARGFRARHAERLYPHPARRSLHDLARLLGR